VGKEGDSALQINVDENSWSDRERALARQPEITVANATDREQLVVLERMAWTDQAATAADVTTLQRFRDLFSEEALWPGERVSVGNLTVLFTDLRSSTRLYRDIGDAPASGLVMNHFDVLTEERPWSSRREFTPAPALPSPSVSASEVAELLKSPDGDLYAEATAATLKGFDDEEFDLWLVKRPAASTTLCPVRRRTGVTPRA
jgi:hypothetical protein